MSVRTSFGAAIRQVALAACLIFGFLSIPTFAFSPYASHAPYTEGLGSLFQKIDYRRPMTFCEFRRIECRRNSGNNLERFQKCLIVNGCAQGRVESRVTLETEKRGVRPLHPREALEHEAFASEDIVRYPPPTRKAHDTYHPPYHYTSRHDFDEYTPPHYKKHYHKRKHHHHKHHHHAHRHKYHKKYHKHRRHKHKHALRSSCRKWHARCIRNWGTNYSDYFGCMEFHYCKPQYYKPKRRFHYGRHYHHKPHFPKRHVYKSYKDPYFHNGYKDYHKPHRPHYDQREADYAPNGDYY